jgi:hypothetical protein
MSPGLHTLSWNGRDGQSIPVPNGCYLVGLRSDRGGREAVKIIIGK